MNNSSKILKRIKNGIVTNYPGAKIYLYGSRAKGSYRDDSDWDLLILLNQDSITPKIEESITYPLYDLEIEMGVIISPMVYSENEWNTKYKVTTFYNNVMREGRQI